MSEHEEVKKVLIDVVENTVVDESDGEGHIHLSTGVVLGVQPFPKLFIKKLYDRYEKQKPKVPIVMNDQKGREEPNPADPDYLEALEQHDLGLLFAVNDLAIMKGTFPIHIPDTVTPIEDDSWVEEQAYFGIDVPNNKSLRYLSWVTFVAAPTDEDHLKLSRALSKLMGITEEAVAAEMNSFPGSEEPETDLSSTPPVPSGNWD